MKCDEFKEKEDDKDWTLISKYFYLRMKVSI